MTKLNEKILREELIRVYSSLLINKTDSTILSEAKWFDREYSSASDMLLNPSLSYALKSLPFVIQKEMPNGKNREEEIKMILAQLKSMRENN